MAGRQKKLINRSSFSPLEEEGFFLQFRHGTPLLLLSLPPPPSQDCLGAGAQENVEKNTNIGDFVYSEF